MKINKLKQKVLYTAAIGASMLFLFFFIGSIWIGYDAKRLCQEAESKYKTTDCVMALSAQLDDENEGYRARNHAIWALGQFGDSRALDTLEKYYTGNIPNREPLDGTISQYELAKAIKIAKGGTNITAWLWRGVGK